jgi:hypothetical protein
VLSSGSCVLTCLAAGCCTCCRVDGVGFHVYCSATVLQEPHPGGACGWSCGCAAAFGIMPLSVVWVFVCLCLCLHSPRHAVCGVLSGEQTCCSQSMKWLDMEKVPLNSPGRDRTRKQRVAFVMVGHVT